jgi:hypothetical protein
MAVAQKTVNYCVEVDAILQIVIGMASDVKAGKSAAQVVQDAVPGLVSALSGLGSLSSELADLPDLQTTVALDLAQLLSALGV